MRLLVPGGSAWHGRYVVEAALLRGDEVSCLARGVAGAVLAGVSWVRAERAQLGAYEHVLEQEWDVVLRRPQHARWERD